MGWLDQQVEVTQADEAGERVIVHAFCVPEITHDIIETAEGNTRFGKNADFVCEVDSYNRRDDRQKARHLMEAHGLELTAGHEVHHAGDNLLEVVKKSIHQGLSHKLKG